MNSSDQAKYHELSFYTLQHPDPVYFIHQHAVDAFTAQYADEKTKQVGLVFALLGLYLYLEKKYTGRQVQQAHMRLAQYKEALPDIASPKGRGAVTIDDVLKSPAGAGRDAMIREWCAAVWHAYQPSQDAIRKYTNSYLKK